MATAKDEMAAANQFDHVIYNHEGKIDQALAEIVAIIFSSLGLKPQV
jgi:guanylate kinase